MRVAIVENTAGTPLGQVGKALAEAGATTEWFRPYCDGGLPTDPDAFDGLVVLGGEQSALDDDLHPYLPSLARLMRRFGDADRAVLGICLGSQLLARAYGAENRLGVAREFGWHQVTATEAGRTDPVLGAAGSAFPIFQWHSDTMTLPGDAVHLAENPAAPVQAFRIGRAVYGTQFHFEANREVVADWSVAYAEAVEKRHPGWAEALPKLAAAHGPAADAAGLAIARAWVALV
ncbi:MAG: type 1 glutamine amidotransferase [Rhodobacteraceae bacterium]|nr:type 1 glutamine amidotransferase [Paracoccaceae bacterium]